MLESIESLWLRLFALRAGCVNGRLAICQLPIANQLSQTTRYGTGAVATDNIANRQSKKGSLNNLRHLRKSAAILSFKICGLLD